MVLNTKSDLASISLMKNITQDTKYIMNYQTFTNEAKALNVTALITETLVSPSDNRTIQICKYLKIKKQTADRFSHL